MQVELVLVVGVVILTVDEALQSRPSAAVGAYLHSGAIAVFPTVGFGPVRQGSAGVAGQAKATSGGIAGS
jgi:hypothetical protein